MQNQSGPGDKSLQETGNAWLCNGAGGQPHDTCHSALGRLDRAAGQSLGEWDGLVWDDWFQNCRCAFGRSGQAWPYRVVLQNSLRCPCRDEPQAQAVVRRRCFPVDCSHAALSQCFAGIARRSNDTSRMPIRSGSCKACIDCWFRWRATPMRTKDLAAGGTCFKLLQHLELTCFGVIHASLRAHIYRLHVYMRRQWVLFLSSPVDRATALAAASCRCRTWTWTWNTRHLEWFCPKPIWCASMWPSLPRPMTRQKSRIPRCRVRHGCGSHEWHRFLDPKHLLRWKGSPQYRSVCNLTWVMGNPACLWGHPPRVGIKSLCYVKECFVSRHQTWTSTKRRWRQCMRHCRVTRSNQCRPNDRRIRWPRQRHPKSLRRLSWTSDVGIFAGWARCSFFARPGFCFYTRLSAIKMSVPWLAAQPHLRRQRQLRCPRLDLQRLGRLQTCFIGERKKINNCGPAHRNDFLDVIARCCPAGTRQTPYEVETNAAGKKNGASVVWHQALYPMCVVAVAFL